MSVGELGFWRSPVLAAQPHLIHAVTRADMNMALTVGPDRDGTVARRRAVCEKLSLAFDLLTVTEQVHGDGIALVTGPRIGGGRDKVETRLPGVDGLVTDEPGVPLMALSADCALVLVYDPVHRAVGMVHAGWRGTAKNAVRSLVSHLIGSYGSDPASLLAAISPCAGVCCYEVKEDVASTFAAAGQDVPSIVQIRDRVMYLDLVKANLLQLHAGGLSADRIDVADVCTICDRTYFSHRREPGAGHFAMIAAIR